MSTRSSARNLFPPLDNPELIIQRRSHTDPTLLNNYEMAAKGNDDPPAPGLRTMKELCQPSLNGRGGPISPITIQATNCRLKNDMIQQVQSSCQIHGLSGDDDNKHLDKFLHVTQSIKVNGITDDALRLYLFPNSLTHHATAWFDRLLRNSINTFDQMAKMFLEKYFPPYMVTKLRNEITNFRQRPDESLSEACEPLKAEIAEINKNIIRVLQVNQQVKAVTLNCETCGGPHSFSYCLATVGNTQNVYAAGAYQGSGTLPSNTITNPKEDLKGITTRSGTTYQGPTIPTTYSSLPLVVERETEVTKDMMHPTNNGSTKDVQPLVVLTESPILNSEPVISPIIGPVSFPVNLNFNISFVDALILMPKFGPSIKSLLTNKDKLCELARTPLNEHYSAILLKKFPEKLRYPGKFLILCDFSRMAECLALADLGASINLMPLSVWNKLSLPDLSPTCMTLELDNRSISHPVGVAEDVFVKVGTFHFSADFVVIDFDADPRVPLILGRSFLKTRRDLIDVFEEVLGFSNVIASSNSVPYYDPIISTTSLTLTPFGESDFLLEEVDAFLALEDDPTSLEVDQSYVNTEGDILLSKSFLNDDPSLPLPNQGNYLPEFCKQLKICKAKVDKSSIDETPKVELKDLPPHLKYAFLEGKDKFPVIIAKDLSVEEKTAFITVLKSHKRAIAWKLSDIKGIDPKFCTQKILMEEDFKLAEKSHFMVKEGIVLGHKISKKGIEIDKAKVDVISILPHPTTIMGIRSFLGHVGFYRRFIKDFSKIARLMTHLLEKDNPFLFSKECVKAFQTLKRNLTEAPILIAPDWDMPFELMCDARDFAIEKEMLAVVYAFEKFWSYLIMNKSIVYTDHFALEYLFAKKDSKGRLLRWVLLLQEFTFKVIDTKGLRT
nr:hypothetical protein [Tanacetum cinerariifolium]GEW50790.1 hypothetical protein [Tanacetum cinerariifolium]